MRTYTGHHVTRKIGGTGEIATHTETETDMSPDREQPQWHLRVRLRPASCVTIRLGCVHLPVDTA